MGRLEIAQINLPVALMIWLMIIPMLLKIDLRALSGVRQYWRGVAVTLFVNWGVKPFSMALLAWIFIRRLFSNRLPADQIDSYLACLILLAAAPCTAMVFVWSHLSRGEPHFTLSQVALNDTIMVFAFASIVGLLLGLSAITVPWDTLFLSVLLYIVVPLTIAHTWRTLVLRHERGPERLDKATAIVLFVFQSGAALATVVGVLIEVPVMLAALGMVNRTRGWYERRNGVVPYEECCPAESTGD